MKILTGIAGMSIAVVLVNNALLLHSTGHTPNGGEIDASIIYADYYYLEALLREKKIKEGGWRK